MKLFILLLAFSCCTCWGGRLRAQPKDTAWVLQNTWAFENFSDSNVSWNIFRQCFIGVSPTESGSGNFDLIFYNDVFKNTLYNPGNCYGMDVMAMLMMVNGGCQGYCHPPYVYPPANNTNYTAPLDPNLHTAINILHGYQISQAFIGFLLDGFSLSTIRDGNQVFAQVHQYLEQGDQPIVSISTGVIPGGDSGHVVVPYFQDTLDANTRRIFVYNPDWSIYKPPGDPDHQVYTQGNNFITIKNDGTWSFPFNYPPAPPWSGSPSSGGLCIAIPLSVAGKKDRLPESLFSDANQAISSIFIFGADVKVRQITDLRSHRRLLNAQGTDLETRPGMRTTNVLPWIPLGGGGRRDPSTVPKVYFVRGDHPMQLSLRVKGPYRVGMLFNGKYVEHKGVGDGSMLVFHSSSKTLRHTRRPISVMRRNRLD